MIPMLAIMVGSQLMQGMMQDKANAKQALAQNKLILKQNKLNRIEADRTVLGLEAQRGALRQQTAKTLDLANRQAQASSGTVTAAAAASYIKGATVDAVLNDVETDYQAKKYEVEVDHVWKEWDIMNQGISTYSQVKLGQTPFIKTSSNIGAHLANGVMQAASVYANQYFKFGSGTDNGATRPSSAGAQNYSTRYNTTA